MTMLKGFMVEDNCSVVPDYILMNEERRSNMQDQISMSYRLYVSHKLLRVNEAYIQDVDNNWTERKMEDVARFNYRSKVISILEAQIKSFKEQDNVEWEKQDD